MMTHHFVMTSSLLIKIIKIDKFGDFSCDIDYNSRTNVFRDVISLIFIQSDPRRPKGAPGRHKVSASSTAQTSEARLYSLLDKEIFEESIYFRIYPIIKVGFEFLIYFYSIQPIFHSNFDATIFRNRLS